MHKLLEALVPAMGWALLHFLWQGLLIGWCVALAMHWLRRARPQTRYAVACGAMLLCLLLPLLSIVSAVRDPGQTSATSLVLQRVLAHTSFSRNSDTGSDASSNGSFSETAQPGAATPGAAQAERAALRPAADGLLATMAALGVALQSDGERLLRGQMGWIVGLWLAGSALMVLRLALGLQWVAKHTRREAYTSHPYWQRRLSLLASRCGITRHVRLGSAEGIDGPITAGCWRPIVLVPAALLSGMPPDLLEALLAHELAHIRRHDYLVNLLQSTIEILLFYHPSVWALSRRIRLEREQIADDLAVDMLGQPHRLAQALAQLDQFQFDSTQLAHAAHGGNLMSRIQRLVRPQLEPASWKLALPLLGLFAGGALLLAQVAPQAAPLTAAAAAPAARSAEVVPAAPAAPPTAAAALPASAPVPVSAPAPVLAGKTRDVAALPAIPAVPAMHALPALPAVPAVPALPATQARPALPALSALPAPPAPPAPPALVAPPAPPAPPPPDVMLDLSDSKQAAYALVRDQQHTMVARITRRDRAEIDAARSRLKGDFLWVRDGKQRYVIQDAATLAQVQAAWAAVDRIAARMDEHGKKMDLQGQSMDAIGKQMDAVGRDFEKQFVQPSAQQERKIEALARQQEAIARRIEQAARAQGEHPTEAQLQQFHQRQAALQREMAPLQKQIEQLVKQHIEPQVQAQQQALQQSMQGLQARMAEASKPMELLGRQMGELAREQAQASRAAEQAMRNLLRDAKNNGKLQAVPAG
ncbi:MAG: peptidase M56 [Burkholderiaceae bacterium]|nr:peptidase M56 [Burkholderiaceae bacterium]